MIGNMVYPIIFLMLALMLTFMFMMSLYIDIMRAMAFTVSKKDGQISMRPTFLMAVFATIFWTLFIML